MKLLTTIAAVLISISAFSQDLIEYNESTYSLNGEEVSLEYKKAMTGFNPDAESMFELSLGTFSRNGEELSMQQIKDLTVLHKSGRRNFRRGYKCDGMYKNVRLLIPYNRPNRIGSNVSGTIGVIYVLTGGGLMLDSDTREAGFVILAASTGLCVISRKLRDRILSRVECLDKREIQFNKVAEKLNKGLEASNQ